MEERRHHPRFIPAYHILLWNHHFGRLSGKVRNMSESGVFVDQITASDFYTGMLLEAEIIGANWDNSLPSLTMQVVRVDDGGIALEFVELDA